MKVGVVDCNFFFCVYQESNNVNDDESKWEEVKERKKVYANSNSKMRRTAPIDDGEYR
jgi:hypothetical protein